MKLISFRIPEEMYDRIQSLSEQTGRSSTYYFREALTEYLDDLEDIYLAKTRIEDVRAGRTQTYSLEEVGQELGLEG